MTDSWQSVTQTGLQSLNLSLDATSVSPSPTIPTLKWQTYVAGDWKYYVGGGDPIMTLRSLQLLFKFDPIYPSNNPSLATFSCTVTTSSFNGHYWQTDQYPAPQIFISVMGTNGYWIVENHVLQDVQCMPWDMPINVSIPFTTVTGQT